MNLLIYFIILILLKIIINQNNNISECSSNKNSGSSYNQCKQYSASEGHICCYVSGIINGIPNSGCIEMISYFKESNDHQFYKNENNNGNLICTEEVSTKNYSKIINLKYYIFLFFLIIIL
jgi:hypothetical protein